MAAIDGRQGAFSITWENIPDLQGFENLEGLYPEFVEKIRCQVTFVLIICDECHLFVMHNKFILTLEKGVFCPISSSSVVSDFARFLATSSAKLPPRE